MNEHTTRVAQFHKWILRLGDIRDGLLVSGAVLYGFGYVAFSVFSWIHRLGPVPGIEAQYFIAGIPVVIVVLLGIAIALAFHRFQTVTWPSWYAGASPGRQWLMIGALALMVTASFIYFFFTLFSTHTVGWRDVATLIVLVFSLPLGLKMACDFSPGRVDWVFLKMSTLLTTIYIVGFAMLAALFYLRFGYERIPQALGGGAPRAAILSLNTETITPATAYLLTGKFLGKDQNWQNRLDF